MSREEITFEAEEKMDKAVGFVRSEFRTIRTGRASPALVDGIKVEYYGTSTSLKELASVSAPEANLIVIEPFDVSCIKDIDKAILASALGITPNSDGRIIRLVVPPLSRERRQQLAGQIKQLAEQARVSVRNGDGTPTNNWTMNRKTKF